MLIYILAAIIIVNLIIDISQNNDIGQIQKYISEKQNEAIYELALEIDKLEARIKILEEQKDIHI